MGNRCTRNCRFCNIRETTQPLPLDPDEPTNIAQAAIELGLRYLVVTSVTRDDLPDGGASHFAQVITAVHQASPFTTIEVLTPDFKGDSWALATIAAARPHVFNHNVETVPRLYPLARPQANYGRSLRVLAVMKEKGLITKSGFMVGLGEEREEIRAVLHDLAAVGCDIVTIGQYLRPSLAHLPIVREYAPEEFEEMRAFASTLGFREVYVGRFVRSSFNAADIASRILS